MRPGGGLPPGMLWHPSSATNRQVPPTNRQPPTNYKLQTTNYKPPATDQSALIASLSLTHSITHSLTQLLLHSVTQSLSHSLQLPVGSPVFRYGFQMIITLLITEAIITKELWPATQIRVLNENTELLVIENCSLFIRINPIMEAQEQRGDL